MFTAEHTAVSLACSKDPQKTHVAHLLLSFLFVFQPFRQCTYILSHDHSLYHFLNVSWLHVGHFSEMWLGYFYLTKNTTPEILLSVLYVCTRLLYVCAVIQRDVPLGLRCLLHSTRTPPLSRYIVDIRPMTSFNPLIHNIVSAVLPGVGATGGRECATSEMRREAWRIVLAASSSNPSPRACWLGSLAPSFSAPHPTADAGTWG